MINLEIYLEERKNTLLFFLYYFFLISSIILGKTARDVYFLSRFDTTFLPHIFIISSICVMLITTATLYYSQRKELVKLIILSIIIDSEVYMNLSLASFC